MKRTHARRSGRHGFTLVELLIVIAIIALLMSLLSAAVWKALASSNRVKNHNEISQIALGVENFKAKFTVYPPSRFLLGERITDYFRNGDPNQPYTQFHADSYAFLTTIFPRLDMANSVNKPSLSPSTWWKGIDWDGDKKPSAPVILEGDQCLVFFLGGIPQIDTTSGVARPFCSGFANNPNNPAAHVFGGGEIIGPFFEFESGRLLPQAAPVPIQVPRATGFVDAATKQPLPPVSTRHFSYRDTYNNVPYAYFSSNRSRNGYNRYLNSVLLSNGKPSSDCTSLGVWPYADGLSPAARYLNPNTFQIISAGANGTMVAVSNMGFGRGTEPGNPNALWSPVLAGKSQAHWAITNNDPQAGIDDQSNFYDAPLGSGS